MPDDSNYLLAQTGESQYGWPWIWSGTEWHGTGNRPSSGVHMCLSRPIDKVDPREYREFSYPEPGPQMPVKVKNQNGKGACFPAGTRIRLADGSTKPIEDIRILDRVLTAEGNTKRVTQTMVREETDAIYKICVWGHRHLRATGEHPILTSQGYKRADRLKRGDMVVMPAYAPESNEYIQTADYVESRHLVRKQTHTRLYQIPGKPVATVTRVAVPDMISLTPEFGRIVGLFLAEGHTCTNKAEWTFAPYEADTLATELVTLIEKSLGATAKLRVRGDKKAVVSLYGVQWARLFESLCSKLSGRKRPHADLMSGPKPFLEAMLNGWLDGDNIGHNRGGVTVSHALACAMFDIAQVLGLRPSILRQDVAPSHGVKTRQPRWTLEWGNPERGDDYRSSQRDGYVLRRVDGVVREDFSGDVFNLEVEDDHSYVAEGVGVHNCNGHAAATTLEMSRWVAGMTHVDLSAWFVYAILCNGVDQGSSIDDALDLLTKTGTCPETDVPYGTINPRSLTDQSRRNASRYKIEIGTKLVTWDDLLSATMLGRVFNFSICVGGNFNNLDSNGVVGYTSGYGNHAVSGGWGAKPIGGGEWAIRWQNSWDVSWGQRGFAYFTRKHWENQQYATAYDLVAVTDDPQDPEPFPVPRMAYELPGVETPHSSKHTFIIP